MKGPSIGLRGKFLVALVIVSVLPGVVGLTVLRTAGFRRLLATQGDAHRAEAKALARSLDHSVESQAGHLKSWIAADPATRRQALESINGEDHPDARNEFIRSLDREWPDLDDSDPRVTEILDNPASRSLRGYQAVHPAVVEILVTDLHGCLIASSRRSTDYDQSDEEWWQVGARLEIDRIWTDVLHHDASANVYSIDLVLPLHEEDRRIGVVKAVIDVSPLFEGIIRQESERGDARMEVVLADGRVLARSGTTDPEPGATHHEETMLCIRVGREGWTEATDSDGEKRMMGFASIQASAVDRRQFEPGGYVLFSTPHEAVVGPLRQQLMQVVLWAGGAVALCAIAGYAYLRGKVLEPLAILGRAARAVAATVRARLNGQQGEDEAMALRREAEAELEAIRDIRTGDEVEDLADDFGVMTSRVLRYHRELEAEVEAKTAVIREDLELAREFQNALMPSAYPDVHSAPNSRNPLRLGFAHFYQPASTVGGDFFDLIELDEYRAGVLIADVMGHGARSALVTAILRALVRNHAAEAENPGAFLGLLNRHLHETIERSGQTLFVTAFFMVLDTREARATWAVAGHPAPLKARRGTGHPPQQLWTGSLRQPALGLLADSEYQTASSPVRGGDVFLLYTDGVTEAENARGEQFGLNRLVSAFDEALDGPLAAVPARVVCEVSTFQKRQRQEDDVCLVAVEVGQARQKDPASEASLVTRSVPSGA